MSKETEDQLIARLLELPAAERSDCLKRACEVQPGLRDSLHQFAELLTTPGSVGSSSPLPITDSERARAMELAFESQDGASETIGPYKLLQKIGEGGFGVVWMAEQQEPIRRRVALKVIKSGMDTREVIARFEAERQALALMDHPNIARVFDAGATDIGQPYFVMELVRGIPITRYCDENRLSTEERLNLFIAVCHAVQHAHQKGIIHRDLKPSNIIVTLHDGVPMPKIIDFGIAKATESRLTDKTLFTQFHAFIGTPAYTSPEQMEMSGLDVDTRSDIYSLGVLLYELLAGQPPFDPDALMKSGLEAMRHTIREVDPPRPSQRMRTLSVEQQTTVAHRHGTDPAKLTLLLRGDLDWIVMHCLEKDRTRRYGTASGLATDVLRYLSNEPVSARPASATYRFRKFIRRHRLGFAAGTAIALSLIAGLVMASVSLVRERAARVREVTLRREADANAAKSAQVARFMTDMLSGVGPSVALGRDTTMLREILDQTEHRLDAELHDQPAVAADLRETLGLVYRDLGLYAAAEPLLREVVATRRQVGGNESTELAGALNNLGDILQRLNHPADAEAVLQEALAIRRKRLGPDHPAFADTLFHLAQATIDNRTPNETERSLSEVLAIRRKAFGPESPAVAETLAALGTLARSTLDHEKAATLHTEALAMYRKSYGNDHPAVAGALDSLGYSLLHLARKAEAKEAYREAFFLRRKLLGAQHPKMVVSLLRYIGQIPAVEATDETIQLVRDFIFDQRKALPAGSPLLGPSLLILATLLDQPKRDPVQAAALVQEARNLFDQSLTNGPSLDVEVIHAMSLYGWWKFMAGDAPEGRIVCELALKLARRAHGETDEGVLLANRILAWLYAGMHRNADAVPQFEEALRVDRTFLPSGHAFIGMDVAGLGAALRATGNLTAAHQVLENELSLEKKFAAGRKPYAGIIPTLQCELGITLNQEGRFEEAERILRDSFRTYEIETTNLLLHRILPRACAERGLGMALAGQKKFPEAETHLLHAFEELRANESDYCGDARGMVREAHEALVALYVAWEKPAKVAEWQSLYP